MFKDSEQVPRVLLVVRVGTVLQHGSLLLLLRRVVEPPLLPVRHRLPPVDALLAKLDRDGLLGIPLLKLVLTQLVE